MGLSVLFLHLEASWNDSRILVKDFSKKNFETFFSQFLALTLVATFASLHSRCAELAACGYVCETGDDILHVAFAFIMGRDGNYNCDFINETRTNSLKGKEGFILYTLKVAFQVVYVNRGLWPAPAYSISI